MGLGVSIEATLTFATRRLVKNLLIMYFLRFQIDLKLIEMHNSNII